MTRHVFSRIVILLAVMFAGIIPVSVHAQNADNFLQPDNIFDTLAIDLKVNGSDGPVSVAVGERITISWESDGAKRCRGNWSKNDLRLNGKIAGKLSRSLTTSVTVRIACIDEDGNREDDSVILKIGSSSILPPPPPPPPAPDQPIIISSCGEITKSGKYVLNKNLSSTQDICLNIHDTQNVQVNCNNFTITSPSDTIKVANVQNFALVFCQVKITTNALNALNISKVTKGSIQNSTFTKGQISIMDSSNMDIGYNNIHTGLIQFFSSFNTIHDNTFVDTSPKGIAGPISSAFGSNNKIINNTIDGKSDGVFRFPYENNNGSDDGIIVTYETGDTIAYNNIKNVWDCGIENTGYMFNTIIDRNQVLNAGVCGIGGWYSNSWKNNTITNNVITDSPRLFLVKRNYGLNDSNTDMNGRVLFPTQMKIYFLDNQFIDNKLITKREVNIPSSYFNMSQAESVLTGESFPSSSDFITGNNLFKNNDFSIETAPYFNSTSMIIDGGGNICGKSLDPNYPLACGRGQ